MVDVAFDFDSAQDVSPDNEDDFRDAPDISPQPSASSFDFDNAITVGNLTETGYFDKQDSVVELPEGGFKRIQAILSGAYDKGNAGLQINDLYARQMFGDDSPYTANQIKKLKEKANVDFGLEGWSAEDIARAGAEMTPQIMGLLQNTAKRGMQGSMMGGAMALIAGQAGPQIAAPEEIVTVPAAFTAGGIIGAKFGVAEHSFMQNAGEAYGEFSELLDKEGVQIENKNIARLGAVMVGSLNAGLDTISLGMLSKVFVGKNLILDSLKAQGVKSIIIPKTKEGIARFLIDLSKSVATESITEGIQEGAKGVGGEAVKYLSDQEFDSVTASAIFENMAEASAEAAKATLALGGAGGVARGGYHVTKNIIGDEKAPPVNTVPVETITGEEAIKQGYEPLITDKPQSSGEPLKITIPNIKESDNTPESQIEWLEKSASRFDEMAIDAEQSGDVDAANNAKSLAESRRKQIEELQIDSAKRANEALTPIQQQEKRAQQEKLANIQAESDDISMNLLREVTALQEDKSIVDTELHAILEDTAALLNERRKTPKPVTLIEFLKKIGGVKEYSGELQTMGMKNRSSVRNDKTGLELDMAREAAAEAGYIDKNSTTADFLAALESEYKGLATIVSESDVGIQSHLDEIDNILAKLDEALDKSGQGTYSRERLGDLRRRVAENKKLDKATAREIKKRESELHRLAADKKLAEQSPPKILADKMKTFIQGLRQGTYLGRYEALDVQNHLIDMIERSGLDANDRAKFIRTIKNTQTIEQLQNKLPEVVERVEQLADKARRRKIIDKIKSSLSAVKESNIIAVDFVNRIEDLVSEIDTQARTEKTINSLQRTLDYLNKNPDTEMPKRILNKLEILNKKPLDEVSTEELRSILDGINDLVQKGKLKFDLLQKKQKRLKENRIEALEKSSVPISEISLSRAPIGERLGVIDSAKNKFKQFQNKAKRIGVATNPMDVFFDMLDGGKNYKGENYKIFKKTIDRSFSRYLDLKESITRDVKNLADKLNLDDLNFEKIGAWAVLQQEGGEKKLLDSGITQEEIDGLSLNAFEMKMYNLMREKLDEMLPAIQEVMRQVYNKEVVAVSDYFPFMTDHDAMTGTLIQDQFGPNIPSIAKKKNVEKGFTISRTLGSQKVRIDALGVFMRHVDNAAYLIEMGSDIKELGDVAQSTEYKNAVGDIGQQMVVEWINLLARKGNLPGRIPVIDMLRRNVGFAVLGFKLSSILIQPTALADGAALVGGNYVAKGVFNVGVSKEWRQFLWKNFPEIRERAGDDQAYLEMGGDGKIGEIRQAGFWALKNIDALVASSIAAGAYIKSVENKGGVVDLSSPDKDAVQEAQMLMRRTQSSAFTKDIPALMTQGALTGNVSLDKLIFQFQSFMFNRWSLLKHDMWEIGVREGNYGKAVNIATWLILANLAEIGIRRLSKEIVSAATDDDEDPWDETITKEMMLTSLGNVPFVSQAVNSFEYGSVPVPAIGSLDKITQQMMWAAQSEDEDKKLQHFASAFTLAMGTAFGVPGTIQAESLLRKSLKDE